jgi:hypothetical protein
MSHSGKDAKSLLSWRQGAPPSQATVERSETSTRLMTTQILSRMEGLRTSIEQTTMEEGLLALAMTPRGSIGIYPSNYFPEMEETPPVEMSDRTCWAQRAKKQMECAPVEGKGSIVYLLVEQLQGLGSSAGFTPGEWRMGVRYLRVPAVHQGEGSLLEWLERAEPPRSYDEADWQAFIHAIMPEIRHDSGTGNTVCFRLWVCLGTGTGLDFHTRGKTVPMPTVLRVSQYRSNGHMFYQMTLLINVNNNNNNNNNNDNSYQHTPSF